MLKNGDSISDSPHTSGRSLIRHPNVAHDSADGAERLTGIGVVVAVVVAVVVSGIRNSVVVVELDMCVHDWNI